MVLEKSKFWNGKRDRFLKDNYNDKVKVDPAMLAMSLGLDIRRVINRMSALGIRNRRVTHYMQQSNYQRRTS